MVERGLGVALTLVVAGGCSQADGPAGSAGGAGGDTGQSASAESARALEAAIPALGACAGSTLLTTDEYGEVVPDLVTEGTVVAAGSGVPAGSDDHCPFFSTELLGFAAGVQTRDNAPQLAQISWVRLRSEAGDETLLSVIASGFAFPTPLGETLSVEVHAERFVKTIRTERLDHFVIFGERHLRHLLHAF